MQNHCIVFPAPGRVELQRDAVPEPGPREVLVQTRKSLISTGTETSALHQKFEAGTHQANWIKYPFRPGYSNVGTIVKVGEGVRDFSVGDRIASRAGHSQFAIAHLERATRIPEGVSDEDAAWFAIACIVQNGIRKARHEMGDAVAIVGLGLLGQLAVQYARVIGARQVIAIDTAKPRMVMAQSHGATTLLNSASDVEGVKSATDGRLADVVYEITGHPAVLAMALTLVRRHGKVVVLATTPTPSKQCLTSDLVSRGLTIIGAHDNDPPKVTTDDDFWTHPQMGRLFFHYLQTGRMRVDDLVTHRFDAREAPAAYTLLDTDRDHAMGVMLDWTHLPA